MIQQLKSRLAAFHNAATKKEKKIKPVWFFFLLLLLLASCQEEKKKMIVCWGDSLTAPHQETLKQKIRGIFAEDHPIVNCKACGLENLMGNTKSLAINIE